MSRMYFAKVYKGLIAVVAGIMALFFSCSASVDAAVPSRGVGLVLSGGGAKGIAHIGVIRALEEQGVAIDYIAGTSMGAIIGGLYAAGYSPDEMLALIQSREFSYWSTGRVDPNLVYYFDKEQLTPAMFTMNIPGKGSAAARVAQVPSSLISPLPMNFAFMDLFAPYTAQCGGNFNRLFVPFRCVASDVARKRKKVFSSGRLGDAIRSSMSFPLVFQPIKVDGNLMYDGGIYDNFPVDVMRSEFHPSVMLGVDVSSSDGVSEDFVNQLEHLIIQNNNYDLPASEGVKLRINLDEFGLLDFPKAKEICKIGYDHTMAAMDSIKSRIKARRSPEVVAERRSRFKKATPHLTFRSVSTTGGSGKQNDYITYLFTHGETADTFGVTRARDAYYRAVTGSMMRNLMPRASYDKSSRLFDLRLDATPNENFRVRIGGYVTSSINSMVFVSAGYKTLSFKSLEANANAWIGQSYMAGSANVGLHLRSGNPSALTLETVVSRQKFYEDDRMFYRDNVPSFVTDMEAFSRLNYSIAAGRHGKVSIGAGYGYMEHRYYNKSMANDWRFDKDKCSYSLGQVRVNFDYNTLNNESYPSDGSRMQVTAIAVTGRYRYYPHHSSHPSIRDNVSWGQAELNLARYWQPSRHFAVGGELNVVYSLRKLLNSYDAAIVGAPAFYPTPNSCNLFNPGMRANTYAAIGVVPMWLINDNMQVRSSMQLFMPWRSIECAPDGTAYYGHRLADPTFFSEIAGVYTFPFASLKVYANYMSSLPNKWNFGISFGLYFLAPKFMK